MLDSYVHLDKAWERAGLAILPGGEDPLADSGAVIRWLTDAQDRLPWLISAIISDSNALALVASRSYRHSNGFAKIPLQLSLIHI